MLTEEMLIDNNTVNMYTHSYLLSSLSCENIIYFWQFVAIQYQFIGGGFDSSSSLFPPQKVC